MKYLLYLPHLLLIVLQCESISIDGDIFIDKEFTIYVKQFQTEALIRNVDVQVDYSITFHNDTIPNRLGVCNEYFIGDKKVKKEIKIDIKAWNKYQFYYDREIVLFHEMAHCSMDLDHSTNIMSIMYHNKSMPTKFYIDNRQALLNNLFIQKGK
jgi:hypothetical protein